VILDQGNRDRPGILAHGGRVAGGFQL
jgi:hypothetical protein